MNRRSHRPKPLSSTVLFALWILSGSALWGCRGRAEYAAGLLLLDEGRPREAYGRFWEAQALRPTVAYRAALLDAGRLVARSEVEEGQRLELAGGFEGARDRFALALEYDPLSLAARDGVLRTASGIERREEIEAALAQARRAPDPRQPWWELDLLLEARRVGVPSARGESDLLSALASALQRALEAHERSLREDSSMAPRVSTPRALQERLARWEEWVATLEERRAIEAALELAALGDPSELPAHRLVRGGIEEAIFRARGELWQLRSALEASRSWCRGREAEARGDLEGALALYRDVARSWPGDPEARLRWEATRVAFVASLEEEAVLAARNREWTQAARVLERLLEVAPGHAQALALQGRVRRALIERHREGALRLEGEGHRGAALVQVLLASTLASQVGAGELEAEARREAGRLLGSIRAGDPQGVRVVIPAWGPEELEWRRELWRVGKLALQRLRERLASALQEALAAEGLAPGTALAGGGAVPRELLIGDLDFVYSCGVPAFGFSEASFAASLGGADDPSLAVEAARTRQLEQVTARAALEARGASLLRRGLLEEQAALAALRLEQTRKRVELLARRSTELVWTRSRYPVEERVLRAELAARFQLGGHEGWVSAPLEVRDRRVKGDPDRGIPPDPEEIPSRESCLRVLTPRIAADIARRVSGALQEERELLYRVALEQAANHSVDEAVDGLCRFLLAEEALPGPGAADLQRLDAARRLRDLTGLDWELAFAGR